MVRSRALWAGTALAAVAALALTACSSGGGGNAGASGSASGASASGAPGTNVDLSGQTLKVSATWSGAEQKNFQNVLKGFSDATGAKVEYTSFGDNGATVLGTQVEGGNPPDIAVVGQPALMQQLAQQKAIKPVDSATADVIKQNYSQDWIDLATIGGDVYGVWFKASNKSTVWYNKDIYDEAGATVPKTWDEFLKQLQVVADAGYAGISIGADSGWPLTDWFENVYIRTAGPEKYDQLAKHQIKWTDPSVTEALTTLGQLFGNSQLVQPGSAQRTFPESVTQVFGADPKAGTVFEGDFVAGNIADDGHSKVGQNALFYDFPSINGSPASVVGGGDVAVQFNTKKATNALMQYLASPQSAGIWVKAGGLTSPNQNVDLALYPDDVSRQIADALTSAKTFRFDMSDLAPSAFGGTPGQGEWAILINFLQNPKDIQGTQQQLEKAAAAAYK